MKESKPTSPSLCASGPGLFPCSDLGFKPVARARDWGGGIFAGKAPFAALVKGRQIYFSPEKQRHINALTVEDRKKCIAEMFDAESVLSAIPENYYDVKSSIVFVKLGILLTILKRDSTDVDLLSMVHIGQSAVHRVIGSCFHFNKN